MAISHGVLHVARLSLVTATLLSVITHPSVIRARYAQTGAPAQCVVADQSTAPSVVAGRPYLYLAYAALNRDRKRYAGLDPLPRSPALSTIAERHSAYMASIGGWSDFNPEGYILDRVHAAGIDAVYAGQNAVTQDGATVAEAIQRGDQFFAQEANGGGPHWDNITNPNYRAAGLGLALVGSPGNYTIYLTQVFADAGGCITATSQTFSQASDRNTLIRPGSVVHPSVDGLQLRSEPLGMVIGTLSPKDHLRVMTLQDGWGQVNVLHTDTYGWVFMSLVAPA